MSEQGRVIRELLESPRLGVFLGCANALSAKLAVEAGADAAYFGGYTVSGTHLGEADLGRLSLDEFLEVVAPTVRAISKPVFVDGETGFGSLINAYGAASRLNALGVAGMQIDDLEDEVCPYIGYPAKILPLDKMEQRIRAIREGAGTEDFMIVATTSVPGAEGVERCLRYGEVGANMVSAVWHTREELEFTAGALRNAPAKLKATMYPLLPYLSFDELSEIGCTAVTYPVEMMYSSIFAQQQFARQLFESRGKVVRSDLFPAHDEYLRVVGVSEMVRIFEMLTGFSPPTGDETSPAS